MAQHQYHQQRPVLDLLVAMVAVPILILCALQLERNMQDKWTENAITTWIVFGLGVGILLISVLICGYVTHRMGVCLWTGPLDDPSTNRQHTNFNYHNDIIRIVDNLPPRYETVTKFDIPPPPYDTIVIKIEAKDVPPEYVSTHI